MARAVRGEMNSLGRSREFDPWGRTVVVLDPCAPNGRPAKDGGEKADDLGAIKKAVDDAASVRGGLWLSYLFVLFYLAVAAGAVTHADLFLENPVKLPFLNIELPLLAFFLLAPILFLVLHAYTLVHLVMLTDKAKRYHQALHAQIDSDSTRDSLRRQLPSNIFVQFLAGPRDVRDSAFGYLLRVIAWVTLVVAPVLLLLLMQIQFLLFHDGSIAWTQRVALLADLVLLWWLWRKILSGREPGRWLGPSWLWSIVGLTVAFGAFLFSWKVATFPGEWQDHLTEKEFFWAPFPRPGLRPGEDPLHTLVFESEVDPTTRRRKSFFSSTLVLPGFNIYEGLGTDDPEKAKWRDFVFQARGRGLVCVNPTLCPSSLSIQVFSKPLTWESSRSLMASSQLWQSVDVIFPCSSLLFTCHAIRELPDAFRQT
jgi:hypothetical protein